MLARTFCRAVLIATVIAALAKAARADLGTDAKLLVTGIAVVSVAVGVVVTVLIIHQLFAVRSQLPFEPVAPSSKRSVRQGRSRQMSATRVIRTSTEDGFPRLLNLPALHALR